jgi:hypothetical protein
MLAKIAASLPPAGGSPSASQPHSRHLPTAPSTLSKEQLAIATLQVHRFFGSFRKSETDDSDTFVEGCLRLFTAYPAEAVAHVVDPITGLPGRSEWLPSLKAVKDALDAWAADQQRAKDRQARLAAEAKQIADREAWLAQKTHRPTYQELKAKYGPNWGITTPSRDDEEKARARRRAALIDANRRMFIAECRRASVSPTGRMASPELEKLVRQQTKERE